MVEDGRLRVIERRNTWGVRVIRDSSTVYDTAICDNRISLDRCTDSVGRFGQANPLEIVHEDYNVIPVNGTSTNPGWLGSRYESWMPDYHGFMVHAPTRYDTDPHADDFNAAVARTNPNRSSVNPVTLAQDLYDLPKMLGDVLNLAKTRGKNLSAASAANFHLATVFGWLPLIDDVKHLANLGLDIQKRIKEVKKLYDSGGYSTRVSLGSDVGYDEVNNFTPESTHAGSWTINVRRTTTAHRWGSVHWSPKGHPPWIDNAADTLEHVKRVVSGFTVSDLVAGAWDLVPWSFVENWFVDLSGYLKANANTIPVEYSNVCVMTRRETSIEFQLTSFSEWLTGGGGSGKLTTLQRSVGFPSLNAHLPFIDGGRASILGSLAIQRFKRLAS